MRKFRFFKGLAFAVMAVAAAFLFGLVAMWLWNALMPMIFGLPQLTYFQAVGLLILSRLFFGGFGGGGRHRCGHRKGKARGYWRARMHEKFEKMSPEEKEKFKKCMTSRGEAQPS